MVRRKRPCANKPGNTKRTGQGSATSKQRTNWNSVVYGWAAAFGAGLILSAPIVGITAMITEGEALQAGRTPELLGSMATAFLAFLYGGYISGKTARHSGVKHGLLVPLLTLGVTIVLVLCVVVVGAGFALIHILGNTIFLPGVSPNAWQELGTILSVPKLSPSYVLTVLSLSFVGGTLGGGWGAISCYRGIQHHKRELD